jgi:hypothetical protein
VKGIRETAQGDVADSYATLRFVARAAKSTRDRIMAARETLDLAGVAREATPIGGHGIQLQIVLTDPVAVASFQDMINRHPHIREGTDVILEHRSKPITHAEEA